MSSTAVSGRSNCVSSGEVIGPSTIVIVGRVLALLLLVAALVLFAVYNRGQPVVLTFGLWHWRTDVVSAVYAGTAVGLVAMFVAGLRADIRARAERRRGGGDSTID